MRTGVSEMNEAIRESLSALLDGEADEMETMRVLRALETDPELREKWRRYHLMVALLRGEQSVSSQLDLGQKVILSLAGESVTQRAQAGQEAARPWYKSLAVLAVAASTAFIVVFGAQQWSQFDQPDKPATVVVQNSATPNIIATVSPTHQPKAGVASRSAEASLATDQERLERHMSRHAQNRLGSDPTITQPFARPASLEEQ